MSHFLQILLISVLLATNFIYGSVETSFPSGCPRKVQEFQGQYQTQLNAWASSTEGKQFLSDEGIAVPQSFGDLSRSGFAIITKYQAWNATKQAQKDGAGSKLGGTLKPTLQAGLGLSDEQFEGNAEEVMHHVATALAAQKEKADREQEAQRKLAEEQLEKEKALRDVDASQRQIDVIAREAEQHQRDKEVIEVQHMALRVHAADAGVDVGAIEQAIKERLERMQEENALSTAFLRIFLYKNTARILDL